MQKILSLFGKLLFLILVILGLVGGGIVLGRRTSQKKPWATQPTLTIMLRIVTVIPTSTFTPTPIPTASPVATVSAGLKTMALYTMSILPGWTVKREHIEELPSDKVTVTKDDYQLIINQAPFGGGPCFYPGQTPTPPGELFSAYIDNYSTHGVIFRRSRIQALLGDKQKFSVCQKTTDGSYGNITTFGHIDYFAPANYKEATIDEMDSMVGSLQIAH